MSVDSEQQVVKLGTSTDMGFCRSRKKVTSCLLLPTILAFHAEERLRFQVCLAQLTSFTSRNARTKQDLLCILVDHELEGLFTVPVLVIGIVLVCCGCRYYRRCHN